MGLDHVTVCWSLHPENYRRLGQDALIPHVRRCACAALDLQCRRPGPGPAASSSGNACTRPGCAPAGARGGRGGAAWRLVWAVSTSAGCESALGSRRKLGPRRGGRVVEPMFTSSRVPFRMQNIDSGPRQHRLQPPSSTPQHPTRPGCQRTSAYRPPPRLKSIWVA
jgi:hypothetical protein